MVMANVGDDSERAATLQYVDKFARPYAEANGIEFVEVRKTYRDGSVITLLSEMMDNPRGHRSPIPIPARSPAGAPITRQCTLGYKVEPINRWAKSRGATPDDPALCGLGISADEIQRANTRSTDPSVVKTFPLVGIGDRTGLTLSRADCMALITAAGLPVPPKSACFFCPYHSLANWDAMARDDPEEYDKAARLEEVLIERRAAIGRGPLFLTGAGKPLRMVTGNSQDVLDFDIGDDQCDSGWCMT